MMPEWVPAYEAYPCREANSVREQLLEASSATLDRLLHSVRVRAGKSRGTRPGTLLRQEIPIRGGAWACAGAAMPAPAAHAGGCRRLAPGGGAAGGAAFAWRPEAGACAALVPGGDQF